MILRSLLIATIAATALADQRTITPGGPGPNRLDPDASLLAQAQPVRYASDGKTFLGGLDDLRLFDGKGAEVPYLLVQPESARDTWVDGRQIPVVPTKTTSGFEADFGATRVLDRVRFDGIRQPYLKRLRIEGSGDRAHYVILARDTTIFDLPADQLRNHEVAFEPGQYRYLRVTFDDRASAVIREVPFVSARVHRSGSVAAPARIAVDFRRSAGEPGRSRYHLQLPGAHLPIAAIELVLGNPDVLRTASVEEPRLSGSEIIPVPLGSARLRKTSRGDVSASELAVRISFPAGSDLDLLVDDGNNPPLAVERIEAVFAPLPWIYFESDGRPLLARYGDPNLHAPSYDLEAARPALDRVQPSHAAWQAVARQQGTSSQEPAAVLHGARLNRDDFRFARAIPKTTPGITRLRLDADVLSRSGDLADVRIVDAKNEQIPYLVERLSEPLSIALHVPPPRTRERRSIYAFELPYDTLPAQTRLVFTTTVRVFTREASLVRPTPDSRNENETLATTTWQSAVPDVASPPLTFELPPMKSRTVQLTIDEGDNQPIPITTATLLIPATALRFYDPGTALTLLYGDAGLSAPRYDLQLLASRVFAAPARDLALGPPPGTQAETRPAALKYFWIAIGAVVLVLLALLARLLTARAAAEA